MADTQHPASSTPRSGPLWELAALGQSVWLDYIRRQIIENGELARLIREDAVRGVTSNPSIFEQAIVGSDDYDEAIASLAGGDATPLQIYEALAIEDIQRAADLFRGVYDDSNGHDGFVSLEVSPELAKDAQGSMEEARRFWKAVDRPNVMIKIPGTDECVPAIEQLLAEGININITLLFSLEGYEKVMEAFLRAMERRAEAGQPMERIASVASFFVSRVDTAVDKQLEAKLKEAGSEEEKAKIRALFGKAAIANAKLAYQRFEKVFGGERFAALREKGARVQRPLWASTSTKNPDYRDVVYVEELIGPETVNTMPLKTLRAFADHGVARRTVDRGVDEARAQLAELAGLGIDMDRVTNDLQVEGVEKFVDPFRSLLKSIEQKTAQVAGRA
ncbi:MAG TPA: transaldolase [Longimicrobiaceae bacterium]|nr:transaldolase [Longimicrobiaceae bacterium]